MNKILHIVTIVFIAFSNMISCAYSQYYTLPQGYNPQGHGYNPQGHGYNPQGFGYNQQGFGYNQQGFGYNQQGFGYNHNPYAQMQQNMMHGAQTISMIADTTTNLFGGLASMGKSIYKDFTKSDKQKKREERSQKEKYDSFHRAYNLTIGLKESSTDAEFKAAQEAIDSALELGVNTSDLQVKFNKEKANQKEKKQDKAQAKADKLIRNLTENSTDAEFKAAQEAIDSALELGVDTSDLQVKFNKAKAKEKAVREAEEKVNNLSGIYFSVVDDHLNTKNIEFAEAEDAIVKAEKLGVDMDAVRNRFNKVKAEKDKNKAMSDAVLQTGLVGGIKLGGAAIDGLVGLFKK